MGIRKKITGSKVKKMTNMNKEDIEKYMDKIEAQIEVEQKLIFSCGWKEEGDCHYTHPEYEGKHSLDFATFQSYKQLFDKNGWKSVSAKTYYPRFDESFGKKEYEYWLYKLHPTTNKIYSWLEAIHSLMNENKDLSDDYLSPKTIALRNITKGIDLKENDTIHYDFINEKIRFHNTNSDAYTNGDVYFILRRVENFECSNMVWRGARNALNKALLRGNFKLASGATSEYFVDVPKACLDSDGLVCITQLLHNKMRAMKVDKVGGPATGAIPLVSGIVYAHSVDGFYVKKDSSINGQLKTGDRVVMLEDVTTTGNSLMDAVKVVEENGGKVVKVLTVVDRSNGKAQELFENYGFESLFVFQDGQFKEKK